MSQKDIDVYIENQTLKKLFIQMSLDISPIFDFAPYDLVLENRRLKHLLGFIKMYRECGNRQNMEMIKGDFVFPPIYPGISPESDWYRFELWMQGKPVRKKLKDQMKEIFTYKKPEELNLDDLYLELQKLINALDEIGFGFGLNEGIPPRLVYDFIWETMDEEYELDDSGGWTLDGCSGYCPGCFQRPWCDTGQESCWPEDEKAGKMHLTDDLNDFVSSSPGSLEILEHFREEEDYMEDELQGNQDGDYLPPILGIEQPDEDVPINWN